MNTWSRDALEADHHHVLTCVAETVTSIGVQMRGRKMKVRGIRQCVEFLQLDLEGCPSPLLFPQIPCFCGTWTERRVGL